MTDRVLALLEGGATMAIAARGVGITRQGLYAYMRRYPDFAAKVREARDVAIDALEAELYQIAAGRKIPSSKNQVVALFFELKNRRPKEWNAPRRVATQNRDAPPLVEGSALIDLGKAIAGTP